MRIRKNAKFSSYYQTNLANANKCELNENINSLSCELNQSPWDIITFPDSSSFTQFDDDETYYNVSPAENGSSLDSVRCFESVASTTSGLSESDRVNIKKNDLGFMEEGKKSEGQEEIKLCGKKDEEGWQCGNLIQHGNKMCDKHLCEVQNYSFWRSSNKQSRADSGPFTECRVRRATKQPTSNPYEFYYYSGFGPSWGKKRGTVDTDSNGHNEATMDFDMDVQEEKGQGVELQMAEAGPMKAEMDSIAVDGEDEKGKVGIIGKKRGRKPVKERSLKSLM